MDRLEAMSILLAVVDRGSFSAAAKALGVPLATVSRKVGELETHLGTKLLIRTTRKLALSDAGLRYCAVARRILDEVEETERMVAGEYQQPRGELILTAPVLFGRLHVLPVVTEFLATYPDIDVRLVMSDRNLHLIDDHVDVAVRIGPLADSSTIATKVGSLRTVVCAAPQLLAAHGRPKTPQDLTRLPAIGFDFLAPATSWSFRHGHKPLSVPVRTRLSVTTAEAAVWAAEQGAGVTRVLHYQCAEALQAGRLKLVLPSFEPEPSPVHLVHAGRGTLPRKMRAFLDLATPRLRQRLTEIAKSG